VAIALSPTALFGVAPGGTAEPVSTRRRLEEMSWADMAKIGIVRRIEVAGRGVSAFEFTLTYLGDEWLGRLLLGESYGPVVTAGGSKNDHAFAVGMYGSGSFNPAALTLRQHGVTFKVSPDDFVALGMPNQGKIANQALRIGVLTIDRSIDLAQPFGIDYDAGAPVGVISSEYAFPRELLPIAQTTPIPAWMEKIAAQSATTQATTPAAGAPATSSGGAPAAGPTPRAASASTQVPRGETSANAPTAPAVAQPAAASANIPGLTQFRVVEEDTPLKRFWAATRWSRVVPLLLLFTLVMYAFLRKNISARWVALAGTVVFLGFVDGGFLSVSLITSVIAVGPSLLLRDLPLLLVVVFTVVTTLLWGRVLCGFLCPFGALQEFLERLVPRRFQVKVPRRVHLSARYLKYAILAFIVILAVVNSQVTIYQYFEPFGTVFFRSRSVLLWGIAIAFLAASAVVPRFYCRYVCPLGAGLGIASLPALFRIKRVDPCTQCLICEKGCPTGAIRKEEIDFTECVRCGTCEVKLLTQAGVCRKLSRADLLVQMERPRRALSSARQAARVTTHE
jgi:ferredoxin